MVSCVDWIKGDRMARNGNRHHLLLGFNAPSAQHRCSGGARNSQNHVPEKVAPGAGCPPERIVTHALLLWLAIAIVPASCWRNSLGGLRPFLTIACRISTTLAHIWAGNASTSGSM